MAIAQGVATTQADLEILRNGVADITECLESKIRDMWDLVEAEVKSEHDLQQHRADVAHERRVSDHETLEAHFARLNSAINDRFIEFDDRIFRMNESRAGSISMQLQESIRTIKRYPDALHEVYLKISNAEAHIGTAQQTATNRIEVIRTEMSRALYDHKERTDRLIADLTARVVQLEAGHAHKTASDHSTPSRQDRAQFFDISDHDADIPRPPDLPPVTGSFFSERPPSVIPRSSLLGPIDHGSPPGCNAAPAEKASTVQSQTSCQNLDEILRRAKIRVGSEQAGSESHAQINPPEPNAENFAQQSAHFSGRSPIQAVPAEKCRWDDIRWSSDRKCPTVVGWRSLFCPESCGLRA